MGGLTPEELAMYGVPAALFLVGLLAFLMSGRRRREGAEAGMRAAVDRAKILVKNGRPDAAIKEIEGVSADPAELEPALRVLLVEALVAAHREEDADAVVGTLDAEALDLKLRYELARALEKGRREDAAASLYRLILKEDPDYADVKIRLERHKSGPAVFGGALGVGYDPGSISRSLSERYMKMELIGKGGMGFVFKGFDIRRKRTVAIKALSPFLTEEAEAVARFMREARLLAKFEHPNVVKIFDVEESPLVYYSMEFLKGRTLGHRVEEEGALPVRDVLNLAEGLLQGLSHIHKHGVVHRDIKPENVLLDSEGTPRFTDFGLAVGDQATRITQQGQVMGTLRYMAPEQMRGEECGPQADLFSLGVTLYEACTGIHAFSGEDRATRHLTGRIPEVTDRKIPPGLVTAIEMMMERNPEDRVQSAEEALQMIRSLKRKVTKRGPATFLDETLQLRNRAVRALAAFFGELQRLDEAGRREFFDESSNVRDLKLLVWRLNESIGRIQGAGKPPKGSDPRAWAPETGQLRTDLARFVRYMDFGAIDAFCLRLRRLEKQLDEFLEPFRLRFVTAVIAGLEADFSGRVMFRVPDGDLEVYGVPDVAAVRDGLAAILRDLIEGGAPAVQELAVRWKATSEGDRVLLQLTGEGIERAHDAAEEALVARGAEVGFSEPGVFKAWLPTVLEG